MHDAQQELDDEILSACHDGELPASEADGVMRRLAREPELAERLRAIQCVDAAAAGAFRARDRHALPERVLELLESAEREHHSAERERHLERQRESASGGRGHERSAQGRRWTTAIATIYAWAVRRIRRRASGQR